MQLRNSINMRCENAAGNVAYGFMVNILQALGLNYKITMKRIVWLLHKPLT